MGEIVLSYDTLFELLRLERSRTELQQLPDNYFASVQALIAVEEQTAAVASGAEHSKKTIALKNLQKIVAELYERRERKIVLLALDKVKAPGALVDFKKLLPTEKAMFDEIVALLARYRSTTREKIPEKKEAKAATTSDPDMQMVKMLSPFPSFVGPDLLTYGPYAENDITSLPAPVAKLLIEKKRASAIHVG